MEYEEINFDKITKLKDKKQEITVNKDGKIKVEKIQKQYTSLYFIYENHLYYQTTEFVDVFSEPEGKYIDLGEVVDITVAPDIK